MMRHTPGIVRRLRRLVRREDGNATVEFMIIVPIYLMLMVMSLELSFITLRQTMLERGAGYRGPRHPPRHRHRTNT